MSTRHAVMRAATSAALAMFLASCSVPSKNTPAQVPASALLADGYEPSTFRLNDAKSGTSAAEMFYNRFGTAWSRKGPSNPDIPIALTPGCASRGPKKDEATPTQAEIRFLVNTNAPVGFEECAVVDRISERRDSLIRAVQTANPEFVYVGYYLTSLLADNDIKFEELDQHEEFFLHRKGFPESRLNRLMSSNKPPSGIYVMNIGNAGYRDWVAQHIAEHLQRAGMKGLLADWVNNDPVTPGDRDLLPVGVAESWRDYWVETLATFRRRLPAGTRIYLNTYNVEEEFLRPVLQNADGVLIEDLIGSLDTVWKAPRGTEASRRGRWEEATWVTERMGRELFLAVNTNANCASSHTQECFHETTFDDQQRYARYYLAAFLNIMPYEKTAVFYYTPTEDVWQFGSEVFFAEWDLPIGKPVELPGREVQDSVYARRFEHALAIWNNSHANYRVALDQPMVTGDGILVQTQDLPGPSGMLFVDRTVLPPGNPSFETPWSWQPRQAADAWGEVATGEAQAHDGARSLRIPSGLENGGLKQPINFEAGGHYRWSGWVRTVENGNPRAVIASGPDWQIDVDTLPLGTHDWQNIEVPFEARASGPGFFYAAALGTTNGDLYFDQVSLRADP